MRKNEDLRRDLRLAIRTSIQDTEREVESIDNLEQVCKNTVWKFQNLSVTQILCETNFGVFRSSKTAVW